MATAPSVPAVPAVSAANARAGAAGPLDARPAVRRSLTVVRLLLGAFMVIASAAPKLVGQQAAVDIFDDIGAGQWLRYVVGVLELAGGLGLLLPALASAAAAGLIGIMVGATYTQLFVLDDPAVAITPVLLGVLFGLIVRAYWSQLRILGVSRLADSTSTDRSA